MLKPFCIRDLLDPALDDLLSSHGGGDDCVGQAGPINNHTGGGAQGGRFFSSIMQPDRTYHGVIEVSKSGYDETISRCPEAKLSYLDDDGEKVTVSRVVPAL